MLSPGIQDAIVFSVLAACVAWLVWHLALRSRTSAGCERCEFAPRTQGASDAATQAPIARGRRAAGLVVLADRAEPRALR